MAEITPDDVRLLWTATTVHEDAARVAENARENLDTTLLEVARRSKVGLRELAAVTGMHPNSIRAGMQRAVGPTTINFEQPELDLSEVGAPAELSDSLRALQARHAAGNPTSPAAAVETRPTQESSAPSAVPMPGAGLEEVVENDR